MFEALSGSQLSTVMIIGIICLMWTLGGLFRWLTIWRLGYDPATVRQHEEKDADPRVASDPMEDPSWRDR